jgi:hypothetical protein
MISPSTRARAGIASRAPVPKFISAHYQFLLERLSLDLSPQDEPRQLTRGIDRHQSPSEARIPASFEPPV